MALQLDPNALIALNQSRDGAAYQVTAFYGANQTIPGPEGSDLAKFDGVPVTTDGDLTFDVSGQVQASGSVFVARDGGGESLVPHSMTDPLAPFGQELRISYVIAQGGATWPVPLGIFRINAVPKANEYFRRYPSLTRVVSWSAELSLVDRFDLIRAAGFLGVTAPTAGNTILEEVADLTTGSGVTCLWPDWLTDAAIPAGVTYESDRMDAISQLLAALNCDPGMTREGALTAIRRDRWTGARKEDADIQLEGVISFSDGLSADIYNTVVVTNTNSTLTPGVAQITDPASPLRVDGPFGARVYTSNNPLMDTADKLNQAAATTLARVSQLGARTIEIEAPPRPDAELGDLVWAQDTLSGRQVIGQLIKFTAHMNPTASWTYTIDGTELSLPGQVF